MIEISFILPRWKNCQEKGKTTRWTENHWQVNGNQIVLFKWWQEKKTHTLKAIHFVNSVCTIFSLWKKILLTKPCQASQSWHQLSVYENKINFQNYLLIEWTWVELRLAFLLQSTNSTCLVKQFFWNNSFTFNSTNSITLAWEQQYEWRVVCKVLQGCSLCSIHLPSHPHVV